METLITVPVAIAQAYSLPPLCDEGASCFFLISIWKRTEAHKEKMIDPQHLRPIWSLKYIQITSELILS